MTADERLAVDFLSQHPAEAARVVEQAPAADAAAVLASLAPDVAADVFIALGPTPGSACAAALSNESMAAILAELPLTSAAAAIRRLDGSRFDGVLTLLEREREAELRRMLAYPDNSAGALADPLVLALAEDITVAEAQRRLRGSRRHLYFSVFVLSREGVLVGALSIAELMAARLKDPLALFMRRDIVRLDAHTPLATIEVHPAWRDYDALPVVDREGRFLGAIRHLTVRQMATDSGRPMMDTIVELSELYWLGLAGILRSFAPDRGRKSTESGHVS